MRWIDRVLVGETTSAKELRSFGLLVGGIFAIIGVWPAVFKAAGLRVWAVAVAILLIIPGLAMPRVLRPVHRVWMTIGHLLGWINSGIVLSIMFYVVFTPVALVLRLLGHDPMRRELDPNVDTYLIRRQSRPSSHMRHQF